MAHRLYVQIGWVGFECRVQIFVPSAHPSFSLPRCPRASNVRRGLWRIAPRRAMATGFRPTSSTQGRPTTTGTRGAIGSTIYRLLTFSSERNCVAPGGNHIMWQHALCFFSVPRRVPMFTRLYCAPFSFCRIWNPRWGPTNSAAPSIYFRVLARTLVFRFRYLLQFNAVVFETKLMLHWDSDIGTDQDVEVIIYIQDLLGDSDGFDIWTVGDNVRACRHSPY